MTTSGEPPAEESTSRPTNWRKGFRRVFWLVSGVWWLGCVVWLFGNAPSPPARYEFVSSCRPSWQHGESMRACGQPPEYATPYLALVRPGANRADVERQARQAWEQSRNTHAACVASATLAIRREVAECRQVQESPQGQREIDERHRRGLLAWGGNIALASGVLAAAPFLLGLLAIFLWRVGRWISDGFRS